MNTYVAGNIVEFLALFTNDAGSLIDPTAVTFKYKTTYNNVTSPTTTLTYGSATTPAPGIIAKLAVGSYEAQLDTTTLPGYLVYEWVSSGTGEALLPGSMLVQPASL